MKKGDQEEKNKSFLEINQQAFTELLTFVDFVDEKLNIGFVEVSFSQDRDTLIDALIKHQDCHNIQFEVLNFPDPDLRFLRDELVAALKQIIVTPDKKLILLITGLEKSIGILEEYPAVLTNLNFVRDDLRHTVCHPMILFLPNYALTRLAKYAPDFWGWGRKIFYFTTLKSTLVMSVNNRIFYDRNIDSIELSEKKDRIDLLLRLLSEYSSPDDKKNKQNLPNIISIYNQLGIAYGTLGEHQKAIDYHQKSLNISQHIDNYNGMANSLIGLGSIYYFLGKYQQAIKSYQNSLEIFQKIDDRNGMAKSLRGLGKVYHSLQEYQQAIKFNQHSLEIAVQIQDRNSEAGSLNNLGLAYDSLGEYQRAIEFYQQSLKIAQKIGYRYGEANALNNLGKPYSYLGEYQRAIEFYQQSLAIKKEIGYRHGEARSWMGLGITYKLLRQESEAKVAFENAIKLYQAMGLDKKVEYCNKAIQDLEISSNNQQNVH